MQAEATLDTYLMIGHPTYINGPSMAGQPEYMMFMCVCSQTTPRRVD